MKWRELDLEQKIELGISIGDKVWTSYGRSAPYRVKSIWGAFWWNEASFLTIWPYPVICLGLTLWNGKNERDLYGVNDIHQDGTRWFTDQGDEVFVEKVKTVKKLMQLDFFAECLSDQDGRRFPYQFDAAVDYSDQNHVFHCWKCKRDFNGDKWNGGAANPHCPFCRAWVANSVIVMEKVVPGERYWSEYQRYLGLTGRPSTNR
jgi:hypothetical protein